MKRLYTVKPVCQTQKKQTGAVLFVSLIILILLSIVGLSTLRTTLTQEKMSANYKQKSQSFQAAESALRVGEDWLDSQTDVPVADSTHLFAANIIDPLNKSWWWPNNNDNDTENHGVAVSVTGVAKQPRYAIQQEAFLPDSLNIGSGVPTGAYVHRVYAYSVDGTDASPTVLESRFKRRYNE